MKAEGTQRPTETELKQKNEMRRKITAWPHDHDAAILVDEALAHKVQIGAAKAAFKILFLCWLVTFHLH